MLRFSFSFSFLFFFLLLSARCKRVLQTLILEVFPQEEPHITNEIKALWCGGIQSACSRADPMLSSLGRDPSDVAEEVVAVDQVLTSQQLLGARPNAPVQAVQGGRVPLPLPNGDECREPLAAHNNAIQTNRRPQGQPRLALASRLRQLDGVYYMQQRPRAPLKVVLHQLLQITHCELFFFFALKSKESTYQNKGGPICLAVTLCGLQEFKQVIIEPDLGWGDCSKESFFPHHFPTGEGVLTQPPQTDAFVQSSGTQTSLSVDQMLG